MATKKGGLKTAKKGGSKSKPVVNFLPKTPSIKSQLSSPKFEPSVEVNLKYEVSKADATHIVNGKTILRDGFVNKLITNPYDKSKVFGYFALNAKDAYSDKKFKNVFGKDKYDDVFGAPANKGGITKEAINDFLKSQGEPEYVPKTKKEKKEAKAAKAMEDLLNSIHNPSPEQIAADALEEARLKKKKEEEAIYNAAGDLATIKYNQRRKGREDAAEFISGAISRRFAREPAITDSNLPPPDSNLKTHSPFIDTSNIGFISSKLEPEQNKIIQFFNKERNDFIGEQNRPQVPVPYHPGIPNELFPANEGRIPIKPRSLSSKQSHKELEDQVPQENRGQDLGDIETMHKISTQIRTEQDDIDQRSIRVNDAAQAIANNQYISSDTLQQLPNENANQYNIAGLGARSRRTKAPSYTTGNPAPRYEDLSDRRARSEGGARFFEEQTPGERRHTPFEETLEEEEEPRDPKDPDKKGSAKKADGADGDIDNKKLSYEAQYIGAQIQEQNNILKKALLKSRENSATTNYKNKLSFSDWIEIVNDRALEALQLQVEKAERDKCIMDLGQKSRIHNRNVMFQDMYYKKLVPT